MKVEVGDGLRVVHDGKVFRDGQTADVPDDVGEEWVSAGWATVVEPVKRA
jgi:hypothetical protein